MKIQAEMLLDIKWDSLEATEDMEWEVPDGEVHGVVKAGEVKGADGEDKAGEAKVGEDNGVAQDNKDLDHLSIILKALTSQINIMKHHKDMNR